MKEKIQSLMRELSSRLSGGFRGSGKKFSSKSSREKVVFAVGVSLALIMLVFIVGIRPNLNKMKNAKMSLERAKSGYNYILQNASKVTPQNRVQPDLGRRIEECVIISARNNKLDGLNVTPVAKEKNRVKVQSDNAVSYVSVINFITELENRFGVTVDQITLDKQGDGIVYISNMILIRLEKGENDG